MQKIRFFGNLPRKVHIITNLYPCFRLFYLASKYLSSQKDDLDTYTLKTWCPGPGAWFDAMDVDRTGDLDLDEAWPTLSRHGFSLDAHIAGAWSFGPGLSVLNRKRLRIFTG